MSDKEDSTNKYKDIPAIRNGLLKTNKQLDVVAGHIATTSIQVQEVLAIIDQVNKNHASLAKVLLAINKNNDKLKGNVISLDTKTAIINTKIEGFEKILKSELSGSQSKLIVKLIALAIPLVAVGTILANLVNNIRLPI